MLSFSSLLAVQSRVSRDMASFNAQVEIRLHLMPRRSFKTLLPEAGPGVGRRVLRDSAPRFCQEGTIDVEDSLHFPATDFQGNGYK